MTPGQEHHHCRAGRLWQHRSAEERVTYIAQKIEDGVQDKQHTLPLWVDMEKAHNIVWKDELHLKLQESGVLRCVVECI